MTTNIDGQGKDELLKSTPLPEIIPMGTNKRNYASKECGAKVISANKEAENKGAILNDDGDEYLRNPCEYAQNKYLVVELCETIQPTAVDLVDFEFFSSHVKDFRILASPNFPTTEWTNLGEFNAKDTRGVQSFSIPLHDLHVKFLRLELLSHHGKEYYCTLSTLRVYGISMVDEYEAEANSIEIQIPVQIIEKEPEEVKNEENSTESIEMDIVIPDIVEVTLPPVEVHQQLVEEVIDVPTVDHSDDVIPAQWQIGNCFKCFVGQNRMKTDWFCHSLFYTSQRNHRKKRTFVRSYGQIKFLKHILKPLPMCPKGITPPSDNLNVKVKVETIKNDKSVMDNEVKPQVKVVKPKGKPIFVVIFLKLTFLQRIHLQFRCLQVLLVIKNRFS